MQYYIKLILYIGLRVISLKIYSFYKNKKTILALDIGSYSMKGVVGRFTGDLIEVHNKFCKLLTPYSYKKHITTDTLSLQRILESILYKKNFRAKSVICTINNISIITREIILPALKEKDLKNMINYELDKLFPIRLDDYVVQYKILGVVYENDVKKYRILVSVLPKQIALEYLELFKKLKLKPIALDINSNCIHKLIELKPNINNNDRYLNQTIACIDFGYSYTNIIIFKKGIYKYNRIINLGTKDIDSNKLIENVGFSNKFSISNRDNDFVQYLNKCLNEIDQIINYYLSRKEGNKIQQILIYGGLTNIENIEDYIINYFNIPTSVINNFSNISYIKSDDSMDLSIYLNAIAALIRR